MQFTVDLYAYQCSITGRGFNTGFLIDGRHVCSEKALHAAKDTEHSSIAEAHKFGLAQVLHNTSHEAMVFYKHQERGIAKISELNLSARQQSIMFPNYGPIKHQHVDVCERCGSSDLGLEESDETIWCNDCECSHYTVSQPDYYKLSKADALAEYAARGLDAGSEQGDGWENGCFTCSVSGDKLIHSDTVRTNVLTGLPISGKYALKSPGDIFWYA